MVNGELDINLFSNHKNNFYVKIPVSPDLGRHAIVSFVPSVKKAGLSTDVITEKPEGVEYTRRVRSGFGINQQRGSYGIYDYFSGSYV